MQQRLAILSLISICIAVLPVAGQSMFGAESTFSFNEYEQLPFDTQYEQLDLSTLAARDPAVFDTAPFYSPMSLPEFDFDLAKWNWREQGALTPTDCLGLAAALPTYGPWLADFAAMASSAIASDCGIELLEGLRQSGEGLRCPKKNQDQLICWGDPATPLVYPTVAAGNGAGRRTIYYSASPSNGQGNGAGPVVDRGYGSVVALSYDGKTTYCTGTIVSPTAILTAAHCTCKDRPRYAFIGTDLDGVLDKGYAQWIQLTQTSDDYPGACDKLKYGALSDFTDAVDLSVVHSILPIRPEFVGSVGGWWNDGQLGGAREGTAVGFGASEKADVGGTKRYATLDLEPCSDPDAAKCNKGWEFLGYGKDRGYADTCDGDSGGPILHQGRVIGVTSRQVATGNQSQCGSGGIYVTWDGDFSERREELFEWFISVF